MSDPLHSTFWSPGEGVRKSELEAFEDFCRTRRIPFRHELARKPGARMLIHGAMNILIPTWLDSFLDRVADAHRVEGGFCAASGRLLGPHPEIFYMFPLRDLERVFDHLGSAEACEATYLLGGGAALVALVGPDCDGCWRIENDANQRAARKSEGAP